MTFISGCTAVNYDEFVDMMMVRFCFFDSGLCTDNPRVFYSTPSPIQPPLHTIHTFTYELTRILRTAKVKGF